MSVMLTAVSFGLYAAMMTLFARAMSKRRTEEPARIDRAPRVTIFKPLAGIDDDLEDNLASFARIDYPSFEILLGVAGASDAALAAAKRFVQAHPRIDARVVVTDRGAAINPKVAQLVGLEREATGEVYVISDSNVRVGPRYLWSLATELSDERVGMVTNVFVGTGERTLGAALENLQICASSAPGYAAMNTVSRRPLTVGKSMAMRRRDLARLGGFSPVGNVLAEDHVLGRRFLDAGFVVRTCMEPVENRNVACSVARTIERHTRWAKMRRALLPAGFAVEPLMTPIVVATIGLVVAPGEATAAALAAAWLLQTVASLTAVRLARGRWMAFKYAPLEVVRSYLTFLCWVRACGSRRIEWRGHPFALLPGSVIVPVVAQTDRSARSSLAV